MVFLWTGLIAILSIVSFGGIHMFAWDFKFPTDTEKTLWRICAPLSIALPLIYLATHIPFLRRPGNDIKKKVCQRMWILQWTIAVLYFFVRLFIIAESFRSLYFLPSNAFMSTWSGNMPHIG
ncbi:hypothetical protein PT974_04894 [Cladobotryum mycophilum]|uniref:Uncharacterized protein n=1 Tax=Cladobotryum mycophilum TaxID=491253 RepID=A0ABR0SQG4_9HYPO